MKDKMLFPDRDWKRGQPEEQGFDPTPLKEVDRLMRKAEANGVLIRNGYLVAEWNYGGPPDKQFHAMSIGKSFTSLVLGLALEDKLIPSLDARVKKYYPDFQAGVFTDLITFRHLATMTAGIKATWLGEVTLNTKDDLPPGIIIGYHRCQPIHLARALTYLYGRTLYSVLKERILDPIGAKMRWALEEPPWSPVRAKNGKIVPVNTGYGCVYWTAKDLARAGHLFLNYGKWKNKRLISADYIKKCWTEIPQKPWRLHMWGNRYGLYWWRLVPGVWFMSGWGAQFCMVWPKYNVVMVKLNGTTPEHVSLKGEKSVPLTKIYPLIYRSLTGKKFVIPEIWKKRDEIISASKKRLLLGFYNTTRGRMY